MASTVQLGRLDSSASLSYPAQAGQQPSRMFARPGATTRAQAPRVQVAPISATVPLDARGDLQPLHRSSSPCLCSLPPPLSRGGVRGLAGRRPVSARDTGHAHLLTPTFDNLTKPRQALKSRSGPRLN